MKLERNVKFYGHKCPNCNSEHTFHEGSNWDNEKGHLIEYYCYICGYSYSEVWVFSHNVENFEGRDNWFEDED